MKLARFGTLLDDYVNGTLDPAAAGKIEAEVERSPEAQRELDEYRAMVGALGELPDAIEPQRDLWHDIEARLDQPQSTRRPGRQRWILLAATLAVALGAAYLTTFWRAPLNGPSTAHEVVGSETALAGRGGHTPTKQAENDLLAATDELRRALEEHRTDLPPATRLLVEHNLEIIQGAIAEIQLAIERDPNNPELNRALVAYYQHEVALLEQVSRAAARL